MSDEPQVSSSRCPGLFRWAVGLLAFVLVLVISESLNASCGDYLHGASHTAAVVENPSGEEFSGHHSLPSAPVCNDPFCQKVPVIPINRPQPDTQAFKFKELHVLETTCVVVTDEWYRQQQDRSLLPNPPNADRLDRPPRLL